MYRVIPDVEVLDQVSALPVDALAALAEVLQVLALTPWNGDPQHADNPDAAVRRWMFGDEVAGQIVYLILEETREVHLLQVQWLA